MRWWGWTSGKSMFQPPGGTRTGSGVQIPLREGAAAEVQHVFNIYYFPASGKFARWQACVKDQSWVFSSMFERKLTIKRHSKCPTHSILLGLGCHVQLTILKTKKRMVSIPQELEQFLRAFLAYLSQLEKFYATENTRFAATARLSRVQYG